MEWDYLPEEILLLVFKYLKDADLVRASCTCKKWRRVYHDPCLWRSRTFEFRGYCKSQSDRLQILMKYVNTMGKYLQHVQIGCPSPNLLTVYNVAHCVETLLTGLMSLKQGTTNVRSFKLNQLHFDETWDCFRSSKCVLVDSLSNYLELQANLQNINLSHAFLTPPFSFRLMKAMSRSKSMKKLQVLDISNFYSVGTSLRGVGVQLRMVCSRCWNLQEITLNYSYLQASKIVDICEILQNSLVKLNLYVAVFDYSRSLDLIRSDSWRLACHICPRLKVSVHIEGWPRDPTVFLVRWMPLVDFKIRGGQCRYSHLSFGGKTNLLLDHLAKLFSSSLQNTSFIAVSDFVCSQPSKTSLANFLVQCRHIRQLVFSDTLMTSEFMKKVKNTLGVSFQSIG